VVAFTASYRELSTDLARLRTAARGRDSESVFYLSRLVSGAHSLLYRQRRLDPKLVFRFLTVTVPLEVRRSARPILLAALLLFGPAVVTHVVVERNPALAVEFLPSGMLERARTAAQREVDGGGYLPFNVERGAPILASAVATNNLQVAFLSFAWGITAGIGTILVLLLNGVQLGGALGLYASNDMLHQIMAFVLPHGVLELTAICIAGGAGLLVGSAFVIPGAMTRREALVVRGRRSIRLVMAAVVFLAVAGPIEGFISPRNLSLPLALTVGIVTGLLGLIYIFAPAADEEMIEDEHGYRNIQSS
jgi:uncharacterized membrane protein SpoIIM required for sporulation